MKRPAIIIIVLIIMMAIIGFERIEKGLHFLISDDRAARRSNQPAEVANSVDPKSRQSRTEEQNSSLHAFPSQDSDQAEITTTASGKGREGSQTLEVSVTGEISPMHFIRGSFIIDSEKPSDEQIDRLREAVDTIAGALQPGAVIFDADAVSTSKSPVLLFAKDGIDLTTQVKSIYDALETSSIPTPKKAEQALD